LFSFSFFLLVRRERGQQLFGERSATSARELFHRNHKYEGKNIKKTPTRQNANFIFKRYKMVGVGENIFLLK